MTKTTSIIASAMLAATAFAGQPVKTVAPVAPDCEISYRNLSLGWVHSEIDLPGIDTADGAGINLELTLVDRLYVTAGATWQSVDTVIGDFEVWSGKVGLGYAVPINSCIHFVLEAGGAWVDGDVDSDFAFYGRPHFRADLGPVELHVGAVYTSFDDNDNDWAGFAQLYVPVHGQVDFTAGVSIAEDVTGVNAGIRVRF